MNEITIFPEQLSAMSDAQLASLPPAQLCEVQHNLAQLVDWVKKAQAKVHAAMQRRYAEQERAARFPPYHFPTDRIQYGGRRRTARGLSARVVNSTTRTQKTNPAKVGFLRPLRADIVQKFFHIN